ncbi:MAG: O-acetylhomoserine aminocarboxypropyltransferase/cysteine synthase [Desulfobacula sp.]|nr:O-acetylhomoserine aminocarboxypropyltransferase/cysteine synthase [Desulfobacula sp.]
MRKKKNYHFETRAIHEGGTDHQWSGATLPPIFQNAAHYHESAESLSKTFAGQTQDHIYMRLSNPTNQFLEQKLAALESGAGAVATGSGMAAINNACMTLLRSGDEFVASRSLFMSSYTLFTTIFKKYGIRVRLVDPLNLDDIEQTINEKTRFVYMETITNPGMEITDIKSIAQISHNKFFAVVRDFGMW